MRALIADDERDHRDLVRDALEDAGWQVELAEDGIAALGRASRVPVDVVLLDLRMPHLDGASALKLLRATDTGRNVPVIVTTGAQVDPPVQRLADCVLTKPFSHEELMEAMACCVAKIESRQRLQSPPRSAGARRAARSSAGRAS